MKRHNHLFERLISFENLHLAARKAQKSKRFKKHVLTFNSNLEANLVYLQNSLADKTYYPGKYRKFTIYEPKMRQISAAPYIDRVVHHALCNVIEPIFEQTFIENSFANRKGKGTHKAVQLFREYAHKNQYVLKCDIKKYFPSIDHEILKSIIRRKIKDKNVLWLVDQIIDNSNQQADTHYYFTEDNLFTPYERKKGIPIGNLTSQFFANIYLSKLDHFVKENLRQKYFIRYVDDFVIFSNDKEELIEIKMRIIDFLESLRLKLHEKKAYVCPTSHGVKFLGYKIYPNRIELITNNIHRFKRRIKLYKMHWKLGKIEFIKIRQSIASWSGYTKHCSSKDFYVKVVSQVVV